MASEKDIQGSHLNHGLDLENLESSTTDIICKYPPQEEATARIDNHLQEVSFTKSEKNVSASEQTSLLKDNPVSVSIFMHEKIKSVYTSITFADTLHRIVYTSIVANFVLYALTLLDSSPQNSLILSYVFICLCYIISAVAINANKSWYGILSITVIAFAIYIIGVSLMATLSLDASVSKTIKLWNILACLLICIGEAVTRTNIPEFSMTQLSPGNMEQHRTFAYKIYWISTFFALLSIAITTALQQFSSFAVASYVCIGFLVIGVLLFGIHWKNCRRSRLDHSNSIKILFKIVKEAKTVKKSALLPSERSESSINQSSIEERPKRFLEYAMIKYGGTCLQSDVKEALSLLDFTILMACLIPYWIVYAQGYSTFFYQGLHLDTRIGRLHVPVAWIGMSSMLVVVTLVPILDRVVYPALTDRGIHIPASWRIVFGMAMGFVSVLFAGCIEVSGYSAFQSNETLVQEIGKAKFQAVNVSIFCQIPQYVFHGLSEAFVSLTALNIANSLCKGTFRRLATSIYYVAIAVGHLLALLFVSFGWFPKEANFSNNSLRDFFFILSALLVIDIMLFITVV